MRAGDRSMMLFHADSTILAATQAAQRVSKAAISDWIECCARACKPNQGEDDGWSQRYSDCLIDHGDVLYMCKFFGLSLEQYIESVQKELCRQQYKFPYTAEVYWNKRGESESSWELSIRDANHD